MLILCDRHSGKDLELWAEHEGADHVHGGSKTLQAKIARSLQEIAAFAGRGPCYAGVSWGKDSVVLAHLCWRLLPAINIPLFHVRPIPTANPYCQDVAKEFFRNWDGLAYGEVEADYCERHPEIEPKSFKAAWRVVCRMAGTDRHISGVRADESGVRKISMRRWGLATERACRPLGWWNAQDVFSYLAAYGLPAHPNYAMLGGGRWQRDRLRVDGLFFVDKQGKLHGEHWGQKGGQFGRASWEAEYYGDLLNRLQVERG